MNYRFHALLIPLFGALFSQIPLEFFGVSGSILQRLPIGFENGFPYLDLLVVPTFGYYIYLILSKNKFTPLDVLCIALLAVGVLYLPTTGSTPINQVAGLFLAVYTVSACGLASKVSITINFASFINKYLGIQTIFISLLALLLIAHSFGIIHFSENLLTSIDRFDGDGLRIRWEAVRLVERMAICTSVTWSVYHSVRKGSFALLFIPILFAVEQVVLSSRGGVALVVLSIAIPIYIFPPKGLDTSLANIVFKYFLAPAAIVAILLFVFLSEEGQSLIRNLTEFSDDQSIRSRMSEAAYSLYFEAPIFGKGYFDIFSSLQWQPFILPNMLLPLHNMYLHHLLYFGPIGLSLFSLINFLIFKSLVQAAIKLRNSNQDFDRMLLLGVSASCFLGGQYMLFFQTLDRVSYLYFWTFSGLLFNLTKSRI